VTRLLIAAVVTMLVTGLTFVGAAADDPGRQAYDGYCKRCHGPEGRGGEGPRLVPFRWTYEQTLNRVRYPECEMPAFSSSELSDADVRQIVAYLKSIK
jgi:mono/diheme cytochrome c family protein